MGGYMGNTGEVSGVYAHFRQLEKAAEEVASFTPGIVPGLAQTPEYSRLATLESPLPLTEEQIQEAIRLRRERTAHRAEKAKSGGVTQLYLGEAALRHQVGPSNFDPAQSPEENRREKARILAAQMKHLRTGLGTMELRILPDEASAIARELGGFTILRGIPEIGSAVHRAGFTPDDSTLFTALSHPDSIQVAEAFMDEVTANLLSEEDSKAMVHDYEIG